MISNGTRVDRRAGNPTKGRTMASSAKKKTTFAKLNRENKLRERRQQKQARKDARKPASAMRRDATDDRGDAVAGEERDAGDASAT
jgi:hypothetical protein